MKSQSWKIDPATRDYDIANGRPVIDRTLKTPAYFRFCVPRTRWMYAPDTNYGSDYWTQQVKNSPNRGPILQAIGKRALQPMIDDGRAVEVEVGLDSTGRHWCQLKTRITDAEGNVDPINLNPIGV